MEEKTYRAYTENYREGMEFLLRTNRGNGVIENPVVLKYDLVNGLKVPHFHFIAGGAIFDPRSVGGIENIVSIEESVDGIC